MRSSRLSESAGWARSIGHTTPAFIASLPSSVSRAGTGDARALLLDEARAAAALNHPHICTIHEVADIDQQFFIVMELVDGRLLSAVAVEGLAIEATIRYGIQIADAVEHAHDRGIVVAI